MAESSSNEYANELYEIFDEKEVADFGEVYVIAGDDSDKPSDEEGKICSRFQTTAKSKQSNSIPIYIQLL